MPWFSETCKKQPLILFGLSRQVVFHDREHKHVSFFKPCQANDEMYVFLVRLCQSHHTDSTVLPYGII